MRFMAIVKGPENFGPPPPALMEAIDKLCVEGVKAGTLVGTGGLAPTAKGTAVRIANGKLVVTDGPFTEAKEVIGGYAIFELKSREEAVEAARVFMQLHLDHWKGWEGVSEVRQLFGPEDFAAEGSPCAETASERSSR